MTRKDKSSGSRIIQRTRRHWALQDAKARFSEVVRRAKNYGPQHVTIHGREEIVVISAKDFRRLKGARSGADLVNLMRGSPLRDVVIERVSVRAPVRDVPL